ncbi:MAG: sigma-54-dependent Fis family transcriptional regulator [bacterium]|nr:sigma-54-dependent Fis family transcriptional regulator [bacterium]
MRERFHILIIEDEALAGKALKDNLGDKGYGVTLCANGEAGFNYFKENAVDLVLMDYRLPGIGGEQVFDQIRELNPLVPVIFMTAYSSVEKAVGLLKRGAYHYLTKPIEIDELLHIMEKALEKIVLLEENRKLQEDLRARYSFGNYVFTSLKMQEVLNLALRAADSNAAILISGESGTGKEVIANIIHHQSSRRHEKFIKINLSALPETLLEAELFGVVKGAFTGAVTRPGKFEEAHGGTLFLDEIGELSTDMQVKLLRVLQEREVIRLGSNETIPVDIRLITATNSDLQQKVRDTTFREDFYFRLNVITLQLPPLRERREDIPLLVDYFIKKFNQREGKQIEEISKDALGMLVRYQYPGNIRELENIIERAVILTRRTVLAPVDLPVFLDRKRECQADAGELTLPEILALTEKRHIIDALKRHQNNRSQAARALGISESGLRYKIQVLNIPATTS